MPDTVRRAGGTPHINRVGHAFFKTRMRDEGAIFGGEVSGHYYFHDFYNADSGTVPALLILEKLSVEGVKMSELLEPYRSTYFISGEINSEVDDAPAKMALIEERYSDGEITHIDGVSVDYDDWHFNVRASNTEPLLRLTLESLVSPEDMERRRRRGARADPLLTEDVDAEDLHARAAEAGIDRIAVPTPFAVGRVNCWLIEDSPYETSIAHGFLVASRSTVRIRLPDLPTRTRACRDDNSTPRSDTSDDQCPSPNFAVSAPAAAFWSPAIVAQSSAVASRKVSRALLKVVSATAWSSPRIQRSGRSASRCLPGGAARRSVRTPSCARRWNR